MTTLCWRYAATISRKTCRSFRRKVLISIIVVMTVYCHVTLKNVARYTGKHPLLPPMKCRNLTQAQMDQLLTFTYKVHRLLDDLGLEHWLMYGSLLGALRGHAPLAWDDDTDMGLDGDGRLATLNKIELFEKFKSVGAKKIVDHWSEDGRVSIYDKNSEFYVDLLIFHRSGKWMKRPGWMTWLFYLQYDKFHTFPAKLVEQPLPKIKFGFFNIFVPRNEKEILQYIYPTDWWKVVKPSGC